MSQPSFKPSTSRTQVEALPPKPCCLHFHSWEEFCSIWLGYLVMYGVREVSEEGEVPRVLPAEDVGFLRYVTVSIGK